MELHRCRFVKYTPAPVSDLAFSPSSFPQTFLAAGRTDGTLELWSPYPRWTLLKTIVGGTGESVESVAWAHQAEVAAEVEGEDETEDEQADAGLRLFSAGLNGTITEWDLATLAPRSRCDSYGGAVWSIKVNPAGTLLASACEDGVVRLYDIADGAFTYLRAFQKTKFRILSLDWHPSGQTLLSGSADSSIREWDVKTGATLKKLSVGRAESHRIIVWSVLHIPGGGYVSGDSAGRVVIWDEETGTTVETFQRHQADVMCLALSSDGSTLFSSGVDRVTQRYQRYLPDGDAEMASYVPAGEEQYHLHDVRAMALCDRAPIDALVTGGIDVQLHVSALRGFMHGANGGALHLPLAPRAPAVAIAQGRGWVLSRTGQALRITSLGAPGSQDEGADSAAEEEDHEVIGLGGRQKRRPLLEKLSSSLMLPPTPPRTLAELTLQGTRHLTSSAISEDGAWLAAADPDTVRLFRLSGGDDEEKLVVKKQLTFPPAPLDTPGGAHHLAISPDSGRLIVAGGRSEVVVLDLTRWEEGSFPVLARWSLLPAAGATRPGAEVPAGLEGIGALAVSGDGAWLAVADLAHSVRLYNLDTMKSHAQLPPFRSVHTALLFHPDCSTLFVLLRDRTFHAFDVERRTLTAWSRSTQALLPATYVEGRDPLLGMSMDPAAPTSLLLWGQASLTQVRLDRLPPKAASARVAGEKRKKSLATPPLKGAMAVHNTHAAPATLPDGNYAQITRYSPILFMGHAGAGRGVVVERPKWTLLEGAPPAFYVKKFGQ